MRAISLTVAVVAAGSWSCSSGSSSSGPQLPGEDYSSNFTGLWSGTASGTLGGQAIPPSPAETEITRQGQNSLSISGVCPDGSAVPASVLGAATLGMGAWSCPPIAVSGCSAVTVDFTGGSGTLANETLSLFFNGRMSGCGQSYSLQLVFTGTLPPTIVGLSPSLAATGDPGFTLTVTGTRFAPGATVAWNGSPRPTTFVWATEVRAAIAAADLAVAGTAWVTVSNPGGAPSNAYAFEVRNPVPAIAALSPASAAPGDPRFTLTVTGSGFPSGTVVQWNGASRPTTVISSTVVQAAIGAADVAAAGSAEVSVYAPPPGGGTSAAVAFPIAQRPAPPPQSVAYQINPAHSGHVVFGTPLAFPSSPAWSVTLAGAASYPLIAGGKVFVLTAGSSTGGYGIQLYALDLASGALAWGPIAIDGSWAGHAYENGTLFVLNFDGRLRAFDAATGTPGWSVSLPYQWAFSAAPTAANGFVYAGGAGSGGTLYAVDEVDGALRWSSSVMNGDQSSPAVGLDGVFVSYPCQVYKFDLLAGSPIWHYNGPCEGGGGKTAAYAPSALYVRDFPMANPIGVVFDAFDGSVIGNFGTAASMPIPALDASTGFFLSGGVLEGRDLSTLGLVWSFGGDGQLTSAPIVVEDAVVIGSASGTVYALDAATGTQLWSGAAGAPIPAPDEQNVSQPLTGLGAGEGYLVVPAGNRLTAWKIVAP